MASAKRVPLQDRIGRTLRSSFPKPQPGDFSSGSHFEGNHAGRLTSTPIANSNFRRRAVPPRIQLERAIPSSHQSFPCTFPTPLPCPQYRPGPFLPVLSNPSPLLSFRNARTHAPPHHRTTPRALTLSSPAPRSRPPIRSFPAQLAPAKFLPSPPIPGSESSLRSLRQRRSAISITPAESAALFLDSTCPHPPSASAPDRTDNEFVRPERRIARGDAGAHPAGASRG